MCGIVCIKSLRNRPVREIVMERYQSQKNRGTQGFGFVAIDRKGTDGITSVHATSEEMIMKSLKNSNASEILFHHRFPTSTDNVVSACHPFFVKDKDGNGYYVVHNGVVHNDYDLKDDHYARGIKYSSEQADGRFNDSEALANEFVLYVSGEKETMDAEGSIAIVAIQTDKDGEPKQLFFSRNSGSPLKVHKTRNTIQIASEGMGTTVPTDHLYAMNYETGMVTETQLIMKTYTYKPVKSDMIWKDGKYEYVQDMYTGEWEERLVRTQPIITSFAELRKQTTEDLIRKDYYDDSEWENFKKTCDRATADKMSSMDDSIESFYSLPVPPLMPVVDIYKYFGLDIDFNRGLDDGEETPYTASDYVGWIKDLVIEENDEIQFLGELLDMARPDDDIEALKQEKSDKNRDMLYWLGVSTKMYELSMEY